MTAPALRVVHHGGVVGTASAPWPFVGRDRELRAAVDELLHPACAGVLVVGPPGVGKTRLMDEVAAELRRAGRFTNRAVGASATQPIPYAAIAHLLPKGAIGEGGAPDPNRLFALVRDEIRTGLPAGERFVMTVDDIALLDAASLTLCVQVVNAGLASVLATVRVGDPLPPALAALESSSHIARVEVGTFDVEGVAELLEAVHGGTVDRRTARVLWGASQGNLLYLRELVLGAIANGALVSERGHWRLVGPLTATSKLVEAVGGRLETLDRSARELAEVLSLAEPLRADDLERAGLGDAALLLDDAGLVASSEVDGATLVRLGHPLYGEVLRSRLTPLRRRGLLLRAAAAVAPAARADDVLRLASWLTAASAPVDPTLLREAARQARAANDFELTERLARASVDREPDLEMLLLLGEALHEFGRTDDAERVLAQAGDFVADDLGRLRLAVLHHRVRLWGSSNAAASLAVLRDAAARMQPGPYRALVSVAMANTLAFADEPAAALGVPDADELADPGIARLAAFARSVAQTRVGDPEGAAVAAAAARAGGTAGRVDRDDHPALLMLAEALARGEAGDLDGAEALVAAAYADVADQRIPQLHVWLTLQLGRVTLHRGHPASARRWFAEALSVAVDGRFAPGRRMALTGLAVVAGQLGDVHASATLLAELDQLRPDIGFLEAEVELGRAWALVALGHVSDAVAALRAGAERALQTGDATIGHELLYEAIRVGGGDSGIRADACAVAVTGRLAAARQLFVDGVCTGSRDSLADAEGAFAAIGADLPAAEAAALLAGELERARRPRESAAAAARSAGHLRRCEGAATPALLRRSGTATLTRREREVALLAARGLTTKAIARQLGLSERTVSNHLQNAYVKLGISTRTDLAGALGL